MNMDRPGPRFDAVPLSRGRRCQPPYDMVAPMRETREIAASTAFVDAFAASPRAERLHAPLTGSYYQMPNLRFALHRKSQVDSLLARFLALQVTKR